MSGGFQCSCFISILIFLFLIVMCIALVYCLSCSSIAAYNTSQLLTVPWYKDWRHLSRDVIDGLIELNINPNTYINPDGDSWINTQVEVLRRVDSSRAARCACGKLDGVEFCTILLSFFGAVDEPLNCAIFIHSPLSAIRRRVCFEFLFPCGDVVFSIVRLLFGLR
jgi:hypothetical protein